MRLENGGAEAASVAYRRGKTEVGEYVALRKRDSLTISIAINLPYT